MRRRNLWLWMLGNFSLPWKRGFASITFLSSYINIILAELVSPYPESISWSLLYPYNEIKFIWASIVTTSKMKASESYLISSNVNSRVISLNSSSWSGAKTFKSFMRIPKALRWSLLEKNQQNSCRHKAPNIVYKNTKNIDGYDMLTCQVPQGNSVSWFQNKSWWSAYCHWNLWNQIDISQSHPISH